MAVARLAAALSQRDVEVIVIAPGDVEMETANSYRVVYVRSEQRWALARGYPRWRTAARHALAAVEPTIVHGHGLPATGLAAADAHAVPRVVTVHGNPVLDTRLASRDVRARFRSGLVQRYGAVVVRRAHAVVGVHENWRLNLPIRPSRFVHIPNIVDDSYYARRCKPESGRVLYCGGPRRIKGWDILYSAWASVKRAIPGARLDVIGWPSELIGSASDDGSLMLRGWLSATEVRAAMESAEVLVIPSRYEVAPIVLAEAWALRLPVVATRVGGIPEMAEGAAVLISPGDPVALGDGLIEVLRDPGRLEHLVAEGRRRAEAFTEDRVARAHMALYEELANAHR